MAASAASALKPNPTRTFGRFELRQLLGKSRATMTWLAWDPRVEQELMLSMPRVQPAGAAALELWLHEARMAARLHHPNLAPVSDIGVQDHWPYVATARAHWRTLPEWLEDHPAPAPGEAVALLCHALEGLAFAHEAGVVHRDLQLYHLLVDEQANVCVAALDIVVEAPPSDSAFAPLSSAHGDAQRIEPTATALDPEHLRVRRDAATRDILSAGLLLHRLLAGAPALDDADTGGVVARMTPLGRETVILPWTTPYPIPEALRAIANRATSRQPQHRYLNARTLLRALEGWREAAVHEGGGPLALLMDKLSTVGHLPALPGVGAMAARLSSVEGQRTDQMAEMILRDMALSFELLRLVNTVQVQGTQAAGSGPVLTVRRAIALVGVSGVRQAAASLRAWPGPLNEAGAAALKQMMDRVRLAGHLAQALRPAGYDAEVVYLVALLQNLGRLLLQYHYPQESAQIATLMQPLRAVDADSGETRETPGMSEEAAAYAVLGVDIESLGAAVARQWGLSDEVIHMIRGLPPNRPVRSADNDGDRLRMAASAANETVDAITRAPAAAFGSALAGVVQRFGRAMGISTSDLKQALVDARSALQGKSVIAPQAESARSPQEASAQDDTMPVSPREDAPRVGGATA